MIAQAFFHDQVRNNTMSFDSGPTSFASFPVCLAVVKKKGFLSIILPLTGSLVLLYVMYTQYYIMIQRYTSIQAALLLFDLYLFTLVKGPVPHPPH